MHAVQRAGRPTRGRRGGLNSISLTLCVLVFWLVTSPGDLRLSAAAPGTIHYPDIQTIIPLVNGGGYPNSGGFTVAHPTPTTRELRYAHRIANLGDGPLEVRMQYNPVTDTSRPFQRLYTHDSSGRWSIAS